jgi:hypothetical protein
VTQQKRFITLTPAAAAIFGLVFNAAAQEEPDVIAGGQLLTVYKTFSPSPLPFREIKDKPWNPY